MPADDWATFFATFASDLAAERELDRTADLVVSRLAAVVPDAEHAALTVRRRRGLTTLASTSDLAYDAEQLQVARGAGPLLDTTPTPGYVRSGDLACESRWSRWSRAAAERGARSLLSFRLVNQDGSFGVLTAYAEQPGRFGDGSADLGAVYATHAGHAVSARCLESGLRTALESRHTIGLAQGILMREYDIDVASAFSLLTRYSSRLNVKLRVLAEQVVEDGGLPVEPSDQEGAPTA